MLLDRNKNDTGKGKYILIKARELEGDPRTPEELCEAILNNPQSIDYGERGSDSEFFLLRLKDKYAAPALMAYAKAAFEDDFEWSLQVEGMAYRASKHPEKKIPD